MERGAVRVRGARGDEMGRDGMGRFLDRMNRMGRERWMSGREAVTSAIESIRRKISLISH
jgi:hypothetical protein